ncbi:IS200/IS605 family transposase, partial [Candidatus Falkowbacteria bacterium CG10_big_fil_rev_8_21_14_0_10_43_11]
CPAKYRRSVFAIPSIDQEIKQICIEISHKYDIHFVEIGVDENHVHFLIQSVPMISPQRIAQIVKSITAKEIFKRKPEVKKMLWGGEFWTKGYYINTVGTAGNEGVIKRYIQNQGSTYEQVYSTQLK